MLEKLIETKKEIDKKILEMRVLEDEYQLKILPFEEEHNKKICPMLDQMKKLQEKYDEELNKVLIEGRFSEDKFLNALKLHADSIKEG